MVDYPPCKNCGASHGMGIENIMTGEITPMDLCHTCFWRDMDVLDASYLEKALDEDLTICEKFIEKDLFL